MELTKKEITTIISALISYRITIDMDCIYCESINKNTNNYFEQHCNTYKTKKVIEKLIEKFEEIENE